MRIVTLIENTAAREDLTAEHGLSLYIESKIIGFCSMPDSPMLLRRMLKN